MGGTEYNLHIVFSHLQCLVIYTGMCVYTFLVCVHCEVGQSARQILSGLEGGRQ